jgi:hypothetical protein
MAEVYVKKILNRDELRKICDRERTASKILVYLNLWRVQENTRPPPRVRTEEEYYPDEDRAGESSCYDGTFYEDEVA